MILQIFQHYNRLRYMIIANLFYTRPKYTKGTSGKFGEWSPKSCCEAYMILFQAWQCGSYQVKNSYNLQGLTPFKKSKFSKLIKVMKRPPTFVMNISEIAEHRLISSYLFVFFRRRALWRWDILLTKEVEN